MTSPAVRSGACEPLGLGRPRSQPPPAGLRSPVASESILNIGRIADVVAKTELLICASSSLELGKV
jgi:hypothetical protein